MTAQRVIGLNGQIPWHMPNDLQRFKRLTLGHVLLMGRATYDSIGRPLPGRRTIVLSRQPGLIIPGCAVARNFNAALQMIGHSEEVFICGGEELYRQSLPFIQRLYLTEIDLDSPGDRYFPHILSEDFELLYQQCYVEGTECCFRILQRYSCCAALTQETLQRI